MLRKGGAAGSSKASKDHSDLLARLAEAQKDCEALKLKLEEERAKREDPELTLEEERRAKEDERAKREDPELTLEEERRAKEEERAKREATELKTEEERRGEERRAKEEERAKREATELKTEEERKRREEVNAAEFLSQPLPKATTTFEVEFPELPAEAARPPTPKKIKTTSLSQNTFEHFMHFMPYVVRSWDTFDTDMETLRINAANCTVKRPAERTIEDTIFDDEKRFEYFWGNSRDPTLKVMKELYPDNRLATGKNTTATRAPGCPDELFTVRGERHVSTLQQKHPDVVFQTDMTIPDILREGEPETQKTAKRYTLCTLVQTYTYLIQNMLKYGMFSNWNHWIFMKREINDEGKEVLYVSPWIGLDRARLGWATLIFLACRDMNDKECRETGDFQKVPTWIRSSPCSNPAGEGGGDSSNNTGGGGAGGEGAGCANGHNANSAAYPETTTQEALGVTALSLLESYQLLGWTDVSHTRRVQVNGRDLVVKLVDYLGVPKHTDFSAQDLNELERNEVRIYQYLQQQGAQGRLAPHFLYHGSDFNQIWATAVTTYEGESLAKMLERDGSLTPAVQTAAITALHELHKIGVIHGDVALRNAIWRPGDGKVIWVDYELAQLQSDHPEESFAERAGSEIRELEVLLREETRASPQQPPQVTE